MLATPRGKALLGTAPAYASKVLAIAPANLVSYLPMWEASGSVAADLSGHGYTGAYTGVDLGQPGIGDGRTSPLFDGVNDYCNGYSAGFGAAFNQLAGTIGIWARVFNSGVWTDSTVRLMCTFGNSSTVTLRRSATNSTLRWQYTAGTAKVVDKASLSTTGWFHIAMTWDKAADQMIAYYNGVQEGAIQTTLGTWSGGVASAVVGAGSLTPTNPWNGYLAHSAVYNVALSAAQIAQLASVT